MAAYIVSTVNITDAEKFAAYVKAVAGLSERFGGEYLLRGKIAEALEGDIDPEERVVVSRFPNAEAARAFIGSSAYQAGKRLRVGAGEVRSRLLVDPA
jgi:uncharacterized protein (DUF1330 family)